MAVVTQTAPLEAVVAPLDAARRTVWRAGLRIPMLAPLLSAGHRRTKLVATLSVAVSFFLTCFCPGVLFVWGPALLGVVHVASDVRYLVIRTNRPSHWTWTVALGSATLIALRITEATTQVRFPFAMAEVSIGALWIVTALWLGNFSPNTRANGWRTMGVALFVAAAASVAIPHADAARALFAYAHNLVAPLLWFELFRRRPRASAERRAWVPLGLVAAGGALLATGITTRWLGFDGPWTSTLFTEARSFVPRSSSTTAMGLGLSYVFFQAVHYSIWLVWIPQETTRDRAALTFRMSMRAAKRDFGAWGLAIIAFAAILVAAASAFAAHATRHFYLSIATFHAYLELACAAFLWTRGDAGVSCDDAGHHAERV